MAWIRATAEKHKAMKELFVSENDEKQIIEMHNFLEAHPEFEMDHATKMLQRFITNLSFVDKASERDKKKQTEAEPHPVQNAVQPQKKKRGRPKKSLLLTEKPHTDSGYTLVPGPDVHHETVLTPQENLDDFNPMQQDMLEPTERKEGKARNRKTYGTEAVQYRKKYVPKVEMEKRHSEQWVNLPSTGIVKGFTTDVGRYRVSNYGRVYDTVEQKILDLVPCGQKTEELQNIYRVTLCGTLLKDGTQVKRYVHIGHLVYTLFNQKNSRGYTIVYADGNPRNNYIENLSVAWTRGPKKGYRKVKVADAK